MRGSTLMKAKRTKPRNLHAVKVKTIRPKVKPSRKAYKREKRWADNPLTDNPK